ncbi:MAG: Stp1/IreP family PP2C-type Ser/Thr phosphatase [Lachnospiraceae bacterium]|nr:Stp1/IreP family PP2C-type Ser/Thr phosphatase [Lachnospiraceae bacterium]
MTGFTITDIGKIREMNQDYSFCSCKRVGDLANLFLVADGMGGHAAGDYASNFTVNDIVAYIYGNAGENPVKILSDAIGHANLELFKRSLLIPAFNGMGTTLVAATIEEDILYVANIGDSRLYLYSEYSKEEKKLKQITRDHSLVNELVALGRLEKDSEEYNMHKNVITRAVGTAPDIDIDFFEVPLHLGDQVLMCSDGLTGMVPDDQIEQVLATEDLTVEEKTRRLVELANENGGYDNIAILLVQNDC